MMRRPYDNEHKGQGYKYEGPRPHPWVWGLAPSPFGMRTRTLTLGSILCHQGMGGRLAHKTFAASLLRMTAEALITTERKVFERQINRALKFSKLGIGNVMQPGALSIDRL